ncbi:hypothetical protein [Planktotalea arctica]|uniref:hypothetical protein n=1 Tax=Planktotalea arctica TaxID=1481893 RepID=UPI001FE42408|nr:hypothetical protein [Planktotalea arctica]
MQIILHAGAHSTDEGRLLKTLFRNRAAFQERGIALPRPRHYRQLLSATVKALSKRPVGPDSRMAFLDAIMDQDSNEVDRLVLHSENFFCVPKIAFSKGRIYPMAGTRLGYLSNLFAEDELELFIGLRNPATHLPAMFAATPHTQFTEFLDGADPRDIYWSDLITSIRQEAPNVRVTVWCNEDTPLIWGELVREIAGLAANEPIEGAYDLLAEIMSAEGMARFESYLKSHPDMSEMQKRRVISVFLDKFALDDMVEEEVDLQGWTEPLIDQMTEQYDEDIFKISRIPGVELLSP